MVVVDWTCCFDVIAMIVVVDCCFVVIAMIAVVADALLLLL